MKFAIAAGATLGVATASLASLNKNAANLLNAQNITRTARGDRAFTGLAENMFDPINGYGCWCYLDSTWRDPNQVLINRPAILAHGQTQDAIDESCKDLINSYKCIEMDAEAAGIDDCDAQAVVYTPYTFFSQTTGIVQFCLAQNSDGTPASQCAVNACIVEGTFVLKYFTELEQVALGNIDAITGHSDYDVTHAHIGNNEGTANGIFDPEVECPGVPNPVGSPKECCGEHSQLSRHPYRLQTGFTTRSCCNQEVINNEIYQCCNGTPLEWGNACV